MGYRMNNVNKLLITLSSACRTHLFWYSLYRVLILYLTVTISAIRCVLGLYDKCERKHQAIYYFSQKFIDCESRYSMLEKLCYSLYRASNDFSTIYDPVCLLESSFLLESEFRRKYFSMFGSIMENKLENTFQCLVMSQKMSWKITY